MPNRDRIGVDPGSADAARQKAFHRSIKIDATFPTNCRIAAATKVLVMLAARTWESGAKPARVATSE